MLANSGKKANRSSTSCGCCVRSLSRLNTNLDLKESLQRLLDDTAVYSSMDEESQIVARLFMFDFEQSGIHLEQAKVTEGSEFLSLLRQPCTKGIKFF